MKRRVVFISTAVILLGIGIAVAVGSGSADPMISRSYWENTYLPNLAQALQQRAGKDTEEVYKAAVAKLDRAGEADLKDAQEQSGGFSSVQMKVGSALELEKGASIVVQSGAGALGAGSLADVTAGNETIAGEDLQVAHRYVVISDKALVRQLKAGTLAYQGVATVKQGEGTTPPGGGLGSGDQPGAAGGLPFADVTRENWFYEAVAFVYEKGYFSGTGDTTFEPNTSMDRAMVATVLYRLAGSQATSANQVFSDVPAGQWYSAGIAWASRKGIVNGMGDGRYEPQMAVTREQLVTMLYRFEKDYRNQKVSATGSLSAFLDGNKVSSWARDAMSWAVGKGLLQGRDTGHLDPAGTASRAEVATILQRFSAGM